jgi:hypothetical protein
MGILAVVGMWGRACRQRRKEEVVQRELIRFWRRLVHGRRSSV